MFKGYVLMLLLLIALIVLPMLQRAAEAMQNVNAAL